MSAAAWEAARRQEHSDPLFDEAIYTERKYSWSYWCNPLLEALPVMPSADESLKRLIVPVTYDSSQRRLPVRERVNLLAQLYRLHIPTQKDLDIFTLVEQQLMNRYYACNPIPVNKRVRYIENEKRLKVTEEMQRMLTAYHAPPLGFPIIGLSGTGKTCSIMNVLTLYAQAIRHTMYKGEPFLEVQIVWLMVNCPGDGSPRGLCIAILEEIDEVLGTGYVEEYARPRVSKDVLVTRVRKLLHTFHVGLIVIDDIQNLCSAKGSAFHEMQTFLMYLTNQLAIPLIRVGTPKFLRLVRNEFQLGKRITGAGEIMMELYGRNSYEWENLISSLWRYQYTESETELTDEMSQVFYDESVGNVFIASLLYKLVQEQAIIDGRETFSPDDVRTVSRKKLGITAAKRRNMLNGEDVEVNEYKALWACLRVPEPAGANRETPDKTGTGSAGCSESRKINLSIAAEQILMEKFGLNIENARKYVRQTLIAKPDLTDPGVCVALAYARYYAEHPEAKTADAGSGDSGVQDCGGNEVLKGAQNYNEMKEQKLIKGQKA